MKFYLRNNSTWDNYGIRSKENNWFSFFLSNRKQYVSINGFFSQTKVARCGVPQGSTLGPLLFLIYINYRNNAPDKCRVHHFADDTSLLFGHKCPPKISWILNNKLKLLTDSIRINKLSLNDSKTKLLIFRPHRKLNITVPNIKLDNFILNPKKPPLILVLRLTKTFTEKSK